MLLGSIEKNNGEVRVHLEEFRGKTLLHIRYFVQTKDGELLPTKKGVTFTPDQIDNLLNLVTEAKASLNANHPGIKGE
jgi:hypothetical protein